MLYQIHTTGVEINFDLITLIVVFNTLSIYVFSMQMTAYNCLWESVSLLSKLHSVLVHKFALR